MFMNIIDSYGWHTLFFVCFLSSGIAGFLVNLPKYPHTVSLCLLSTEKCSKERGLFKGFTNAAEGSGDIFHFRSTGQIMLSHKHKSSWMKMNTANRL